MLEPEAEWSSLNRRGEKKLQPARVMFMKAERQTEPSAFGGSAQGYRLEVTSSRGETGAWSGMLIQVDFFLWMMKNYYI